MGTLVPKICSWSDGQTEVSSSAEQGENRQKNIAKEDIRTGDNIRMAVSLYW